MADVGSVKYKVELDNSGLDKDTQTTEKTISSKLDAISGKISKSFGYQVLKDIGSAFLNLGKEAVQGFTEMSKAALESTASLEQNMGGVETLFKGSADTVIANAKRAYTTAGMSANQYMETVTSFSASLLQSLGGDTKKAAAAADQAIIDMSDNANKMGTSIGSIQAAYQGFAKQNYTMLDNLKLGYGGTKTEMERLLADASKLSGVKYDISNLNDVYEAIHVIQGELGITGTTAAEASATIEGSMNAAKAAYDNFLNGTITGEEFAETLAVAAENVASNLAVIIQNFADQLPGIVAVVSERLPSLLSTIGPPILDALGAVAKSAVTVGGDIATSVADGIKEHGPEMIQKGVELIADLISGISGSIPNVMSTTTQVIVQMLAAIQQNLPQLVQSGIQLVSSLADGLIQNVPVILAAVGQLILSLLGEIINHLPEILEKGSEIVGKLAEGLIKAIPKLLDGIGQLLAQAKDAFLKTDWAGIGRNIIDGVVNGLKAAGSNLFNAMKNMAGDALQAAKDTLKINSPSKVFENEVGESIPEGMALGVTKNAGMVTDAVAGLADGLAVDADLHLPDMSGIGEDLGATISATTSQTIEIPVVLDGREIARATAWYTNEQLAWEARG